jgi:hypothetical protein
VSRTPTAPVAVGLCRDQYHRYFWEGEGPLVSVTTVGKILYSFPLERWKLEGVARRALRDLDILIPLRDRGDEEAAVRLLLDSRDPSFDARERGTAFHSWSESFDKGQPEPVPFGLIGEAAGYERWVEEVRPEWIAVEELVANLQYGYGGTLDRIARIADQVWLLDVKTSKTVADARGRVWDDMRMQLGAYAGAEFMGRPGDPLKYAIPAIERHGIVHVTATETRLVEAAVTRADWLAFLQALSLHRWKKEGAA